MMKLSILRGHCLRQVARPNWRFLGSRRFSTEKKTFDYDVVIVGGGSGGLACAQEAADLGKRVAVLDFVKPSIHGTKWGLGGTCVNVGCIPKKLMHHSSIIGDFIEDSHHYGWKLGNQSDESEQKQIAKTHQWPILAGNVAAHIKSLNWGYLSALIKKNVKYLNATGRFVDPHTIIAKDKKDKETTITSENFVVATGGRPAPLSIPGGELAITSDDIFWRTEAPGKTLVIGASYVALECAGFLTGFGFDTTVMARSIYLRGYDQEMAGHIVDYMKTKGTSFLEKSIIQKIEKVGEGKLKLLVTWRNQDGKESQDTFDTVLSAIGRVPSTNSIGLEQVGIEIHKDSRKIVVGSDDCTAIESIYAIGDVVHGAPELTPTAVRAGRLLARRLAGTSNVLMDYENVPTTVFTPLEYGCCGMSEEMARAMLGADNIEVYHSHFTPLEWTLPHRIEDNTAKAKIICDKKDKNRVVGVHLLAPNAGEIIQGLAIAMKAGARKQDFDDTLGIHPTVAEEFTLLRVSKRSGDDPKKTLC